MNPDTYAMSSAAFKLENLVEIASGDYQSFWQWVIPIPGAGAYLQTSFNLGGGTNDLVSHIAPLDMQLGRYYRIRKNWSGASVGDLGGIKITSITTKAHANVKLLIGDGGAWMDVNENGIYDENKDRKLSSGGTLQFDVDSIGAEEHKWVLYGDIIGVNFAVNPHSSVTEMFAGCPHLQLIDLSNGILDQENLKKLVDSLPDRTGLEPGGKLYLHKNDPL